jgi:hypothetical protein
VDAEFGWREGEDQPARMGFNAWPFEDIPKNRAELVGLRGVEQAMDSSDRHNKSVDR